MAAMTVSLWLVGGGNMSSVRSSVPHLQPLWVTLSSGSVTGEALTWEDMFGCVWVP